jgi:hypothetical protein
MKAVNVSENANVEKVNYKSSLQQKGDNILSVQYNIYICKVGPCYQDILLKETAWKPRRRWQENNNSVWKSAMVMRRLNLFDSS